MTDAQGLTDAHLEAIGNAVEVLELRLDIRLIIPLLRNRGILALRNLLFRQLLRHLELLCSRERSKASVTKSQARVATNR